MGFMSINLAGITPAGQPKQQQKLVSGCYKGMVVGLKQNQKGDKTYINFTLEVDGIKIYTNLKVATSATDPVIFYWRACAESCGVEEVDEITEWEEEHFLSKTCYIQYEDDGVNYPSVKWITPYNFDVVKEMFDKKNTKTPTKKEIKEPKEIKEVKEINITENPFSDLEPF